jgi:hypothetical protein
MAGRDEVAAAVREARRLRGESRRMDAAVARLRARLETLARGVPDV